MSIAEPQSLVDHVHAGAPAQVPCAKTNQRNTRTLRFGELHGQASQAGACGGLTTRPSDALEPADGRHLLVAQREVEHREIGGKVIGIGGARNRNDALLHQIAQRDLRRRLAMRRADAIERVVVRDLPSRQRAIGGDREAMLAAGRDDLGLVEKRMDFDLVVHQRLIRGLNGLIQHPAGEICHADVARQPGALERAQRLHAFGHRNLRARPVDQQQIDGRKVERLEALIDGTLELVEPVPINLGGQEHIVAADARCANPLPHFAFVAVVLGRVDVAVAEVQRGLDRLDTHVALQRHGAKADARNPGAIGFDDVHRGTPRVDKMVGMERVRSSLDHAAEIFHLRFATRVASRATSRRGIDRAEATKLNGISVRTGRRPALRTRRRGRGRSP